VWTRSAPLRNRWLIHRLRRKEITIQSAERAKRVLGVTLFIEINPLRLQYVQRVHYELEKEQRGLLLPRVDASWS